VPFDFGIFVKDFQISLFERRKKKLCNTEFFFASGQVFWLIWQETFDQLLATLTRMTMMVCDRWAEMKQIIRSNKPYADLVPVFTCTTVEKGTPAGPKIGRKAPVRMNVFTSCDEKGMHCNVVNAVFFKSDECFYTL
jgi:hypothetical protein